MALAVPLLVVGAVTGVVGQSGPGTAAARGVVAPPAEVVSARDASSAIASLQDRLRALPQDWSAWSSLGALYTSQARLTADPSYYTKADGAFARSLQIRPHDNAGALTGQATLAASRHDFDGALALTQQAADLNAYGSTNLGVMSDALAELGRYPQAWSALQRMVDLKPGVASYSRVSYSYELRGDDDGARFALERALEVAQSPADQAFALQYLGELAFNQGDLPTAERHFADGLRRDPSYVPLLAGRARVEAARGRTEQALRDWAEVTTRLPQPTYLIEYAELLASAGKTDEARQQYAVIDATVRLFRAAGANVDLELSLYDADHGRSRQAVATAGAELRRRTSIQVEDAYAWALHSAGRDREALVHSRRAAALGMRNALFAYHRGMIEKSLGRNADARTSLTRALRTNPYFSPVLAPKARASLASLKAQG
ncbi:tetratricopeptide repeat protein [Angustibacter peucedani]